VLILNKHNPKVFQRLEECILVGYSKDSKSYRLYHRPSHRIIESFHVVFIESKDDCDKPFRPGVTQGLDDDTDTPSQTTPSNTPATPTILLHVVPVPIPVSAAPTPSPTLITGRKSSRIPAPSTCLAEATGFNKIGAVQRATSEARMSKARLDADCAQRKRTHTVSNDPTLPRPRTRTQTTSNNPTNVATPTPSDPPASTPLDTNSMLETELAHILEALANDGFEWGLTSDDDFDAEYPDDPATLEEALASEDAPKWLAGCEEGLASIKKLGVFDLVPRSQCTGQKVLKGKFMFRVKHDALGKAVRWKVQYVVKGYEAIYGVDYKKTTSLTMQLETFRIIAHLSTVFGWKMHQIDIVTAFLRGALAEGEEVYIEQPNGFKFKGKEDYV
jgi:Reverse transcriptase (RNA-dependent DNA polymerase)